MRQIVILMAFLTWGPKILSQCHSPGFIAIEQHGDSIEIKHTELPFPCVTPEWERVVWYIACNPYNYQQRYPVDTLDVGESLWLDASEPFFAIWAQYQYKSDQIQTNGGVAMSSNTVYWVTPDAPHADITIMPNPNDGNFLLDLESNGTGGVFRVYGGIGGMVLSKTFTGGSKEEQVSIPNTWLNPNGVYEVVADFFFDGCVDKVRVRRKFILSR